MIDPRREMILIRPRDGGPFRDETSGVESYAIDGGTTHVKFLKKPKIYGYDAVRVAIVQHPEQLAVEDGARIDARGKPWERATEAWLFHGPDGDLLRVFTRGQTGETHKSYPAEQVHSVPDAASTEQAAPVLAYWRRIVDHLPDKDGNPDPLRASYETLDHVHPESVLGRLLNGIPISEEPDDLIPIFPFSSNLSQREAVQNAIRYPISAIEGPPGTGKTQTILNLVSTLIASPGRSVGVVSFNNAAVDNVRDKLIEMGFGYVLASLGRREKREEFFDTQASRAEEVGALLNSPPEERPDPEHLRGLDARLDQYQHDERDLHRLRREREATELERRHFIRLRETDIDTETDTSTAAARELDGIALLNRTSDRILEFLAETELPETGGRLRAWLRRIRWLIKYGSLWGVDTDSTELVLRLYGAYYDRRIAELTRQIDRLEQACKNADLPRLLDEQRDLSLAYLREGLRDRYRGRSPSAYDARDYRRQMDEFLTDYPVVLSTCHSLRNSLDARRLLDYLVIDEASQLDLATAALVLASCRRVVIVGDLRQLPHIPNGTAAEQAGTAPHPAFDYRTHNALSSFTAYYRESLPKTVLREHYRCHPAIIGFCNQKFYDGILIPHSDAAPAPNALTLHPTAPGNHMRQFTRGGRINRREVEVIEREVLPRLLEEFTREEIGITTPYRRQVSVVADTLLSELAAIEADTVHRYQGREKDAIVMTTVLDESEQGRRGLTFVDDPRLINVAVSRAKRRFVLVTDNEMLPTSRHLRDLIGYIRYQNPEEDPPESGVVSVFDLLYQKYSEKLRTLADRVSGPSRFTSENIIWTVLHDILAEDSYAGLTVTPQVLLRTLVPRLAELTPEQAAYVQHRASLDFVVYNGVTKLPLLAIEVDGFAYHDDDVQQLARDELKNAILRSSRIPLLRLSTIGSAERQRICSALDKALVADVGGRA